ncbi:MAG TPA: MogA/MoaB family molybdenum cofactor biosynthesis protein [Deltaproteobacteria bacterium]|nr:MogA/MoaB family molybdenum cofactor biosynthesis protein [Deltaproteobacteria bacterium]
MKRAGVLTLSDKGASGLRRDESGPVVCGALTAMGIAVESYEVIPDDMETIVNRLKALCDELGLDLAVTTGGTGLTPRDVTPEATLAVIHRRVPGMEEAMRMESMKKTPHAMISRAVVGTRDRTLIVNLPGSPKAARECLEVIAPALGHALDKLGGDTSDCGA